MGVSHDQEMPQQQYPATTYRAETHTVKTHTTKTHIVETQIHYNLFITVHYNTVLDITRFKDGSQKNV